jgi:hypothetical protein
MTKLSKAQREVLKWLNNPLKEGPIPQRLCVPVNKLIELKLIEYDDEGFVSLSKRGRAALKDTPK